MSNIDYTKHSDKRVNNPTIENRNFFAAEESKPYNTMYPRDPSLDPQLVWKGKDEQDKEDLAVPTVPIYIQEKVLPAAIIKELQSASATKPEQTEQPDLFGDFNGIESFEKEVEFYQHEKHWSNRMILGDSLLVMNSLAEKEGLKGKVQCIYIDPPYGIKFGSNWQVSTRKRDVKDGKAEYAAREPEVVRAFRDTWKLGIHSYLSYLRDRFRVAQELLTETGSIFVQIGDENVHLVRCVMDEVFGSENFISLISVKKTGGLGSDLLKNINDYIVWYAKDKGQIKYRQPFLDKADTAIGDAFTNVLLPSGKIIAISEFGEEELPGGAVPVRTQDLNSSGLTTTCVFPYVFNGRTYQPLPARSWKTNLEGMERLASANRLIATGSTLRFLIQFDDFPVAELSNLWADTGGSPDRLYVVQTATKIVQRCLLMCTDPGDLVLDPTCGSGTSAYVAEQWGRRWITVDTSRVALALARTRLMCARFPYYLLSDSPEGVKKESELTQTVPPNYATSGDIKKGFVYKRVPHVTLKSIANNPDIKDGMTREEIDKAIAKHAESESLFDQPYEDNKRIRVTGPFTVESLSPHRTLQENVEAKDMDLNADELSRTGDFNTMALDNLRKAGIQNTKKGERLQFESLQPYAGRWIQAKGTYKTADGAEKRVAISIGPEYGAVSPMQIKEAAKEAVEGLGHDLLVVCGYAFDPHVGEEAKKYGELTVLPTKMNADLLMADELLKKTGAGNLFMVFGEPDIEVRREKENVVVEIRGLDVYDPTTGEIRSSSTDDIACWFIDTNYNGESFFVRHAYFCGAEVTDKKDGQKYDPYRALRSTLKAEIDADAWASLYSSACRPFPKPETGKIAVKVINHYGDEIVKVYEVS